MDKPVMGDGIIMNETVKVNEEKEAVTKELAYFMFVEKALTNDYQMHEHRGKQIVDRLDKELVILREMKKEIVIFMDEVFGMRSGPNRPIKEVAGLLAKVKRTVDKLEE
jgi:hypothetical protein